VISDTLYTACYEIEEYQRTMPRAYDRISTEIEVVHTFMLAFLFVAKWLPAPDDDEETEQLRAAIRQHAGAAADLRALLHTIARRQRAMREFYGDAGNGVVS
jgi:hypothetical protein